MPRPLALLRSAVHALGRAPVALLCLAALVLGGLYASNDLADGDPAAPRGDGRYRPLMARGDGHMHFLITRSLVFDRDTQWDDDLARFGDPWNQPRTVTGRKNIMQPIGPSLLWAPVLAVAHAAALVGNVFGAGIATHGFTMFHQRILFATSVLFAWVVLVLGAWLARRLVGGRWAPTWAAIAIVLGTPLTYYATYMPSYAHAMDAAVAGAFLTYWAITIGQVRVRRFVALGLLLGVAALVRMQDILFGALIALELAVLVVAQLRREGARAAARALPGLVGRGGLALALALLVLVPQFLVWKQMYGAYVAHPGGPGQVRYGHARLLELLYAARNGWFAMHPIAYLAVIGLGVGVVRGPRLGPRVRAVCAGLLVAIAAQAYVNACTIDWWGSASYGQRRMVGVSVPLVVGLAVLLRAVHRAAGRRVPAWGQQAIAVGVLGYLVAWNLAWMHPLRRAHPAGRDDRPTCCDDVPAPLAWIARPVYAAIGNPFQLPASAWFALAHDTDLHRWDVAVGSYPLVPAFLAFTDGSYRHATGAWDLAAPGGERYLLAGWGPAQAAGARRWRWTIAPEARALLPLLIPEPHTVTIPLAAAVAPGATVPVVIRLDGREVGRADVGAAWTTVTITTDGAIGSRELAIAAPLAAPAALPAGAPAPPPGGAAVGVAVGPWRVAFPR